MSEACGCKVGRSIEKYNLVGLNEELARRHADEDASLRDLAAFVNQRILATAIAEAGSLDAETEVFGAMDSDEAVRRIYARLTDETTPIERETRVRMRLKQDGIEIDRIEADWVTHPTIRTHLRSCLGHDTSPSPGIDPEGAHQTIEWARSRCRGVVERTIERLQASNHVSITRPDVAVTIRITCMECQETYRPIDLIAATRCGCPEHPS